MHSTGRDDRQRHDDSRGAAHINASVAEAPAADRPSAWLVGAQVEDLLQVLA